MIKNNLLFKSNIVPKSDTDLGYYLAGLIEGDGHFSKNQLIISGHEKDYEFFHALKHALGYGKVSQYTRGRALRFVISSKAGLRRVILLCNGKFVGWHKFNQLLKHNYSKHLNIVLQQPKEENMSFSNFWFCGFIEADGCFNITIRKCNTNAIKTRVDLRLTIAQKDSYLLQLIRRQFIDAQMYESKNSKNRHFRLTISGHKRLPTVIHYFDQYPLQTRKYIHYRMFRRCFRLVQFKKHLNFKGLEAARTIQTMLTSVYK